MYKKIDLKWIYNNQLNHDDKSRSLNISFDWPRELLDIMIWDSKKGELTINISKTDIHIEQLTTFFRSNWIWVATVKRLCEYAKSCNKKYISLSAFNPKTMKYRIELGFCPDKSIAIELLNSMKNIITYYQDPQYLKKEWNDLSVRDIEDTLSRDDLRIYVKEKNRSYFVWLLNLLRKNTYYRWVLLLAIESRPNMSWIFVLDEQEYPDASSDCRYMLNKYFDKKKELLVELL